MGSFELSALLLLLSVVLLELLLLLLLLLLSLLLLLPLKNRVIPSEPKTLEKRPFPLELLGLLSLLVVGLPLLLLLAFPLFVGALLFELTTGN